MSKRDWIKQAGDLLELAQDWAASSQFQTLMALGFSLAFLDGSTYAREDMQLAFQIIAALLGAIGALDLVARIVARWVRRGGGT